MLEVKDPKELEPPSACIACGGARSPLQPHKVLLRAKTGALGGKSSCAYFAGSDLGHEVSSDAFTCEK